MIPGDALLKGAYAFDSESGEFINENFQRIAEVIYDYNPELRLMWIPPKERTSQNHKPYGIAHYPSNGKPAYMVMVLGEDELNHTLIARLWTMQQNTPNLLSYLEAQETAAKALQLKEQKDAMEEAHDKAKSIFKTPLHSYRLGKDKVLHL